MGCQKLEHPRKGMSHSAFITSLSGIGRIKSHFYNSIQAVVLAAALINAWSWPLRASIIILVLGSIGLILVVAQFVLDYGRADGDVSSKLDYEIPSFDDTDSKTIHRGDMEI